VLKKKSRSEQRKNDRNAAKSESSAAFKRRHDPHGFVMSRKGEEFFRFLQQYGL
jgi:hypothetical protein